MAAAQVQSARPLCTCPPVRTASPATRVASAPPYRPMDASGSCCSPARVKAPSVEPVPSLVSASILLSVCGWPAGRLSVRLSVCLPACLSACLPACLAGWLAAYLAVCRSTDNRTAQHSSCGSTSLCFRCRDRMMPPVAPCSIGIAHHARRRCTQ